MRPVIGITQDIEYKADGTSFWAYLDRHYSEAVFEAGGLPMLLPILGTEEAARLYAGRIDGLLMSGGDDIHPRYYGEELTDKVSLSPDIRTEFDFWLLREMLALGKPVLGICLGVQEMNVYFGGSLHQDLPGHKAEGSIMRHDVEIKPGSLLQRITGESGLNVNSYHHQAIKSVANGLTASAVAQDGIAEAIELPAARFVLGLQWHPERLCGEGHTQRLFAAFVEACRG